MKVKFLPQNVEVEVVPGKSLLQVATENHLEIKSVCKGVPSCAECRVKIVSGENNVFPPNKAELNLIGTSYYIDSRRLSCQVKCFGDLVVDLTEQVERSETQSKKVRGYRSPKHQESHAVQDTMILKEQPIVEQVGDGDASTTQQSHREGPRGESSRENRGTPSSRGNGNSNNNNNNGHGGGRGKKRSGGGNSSSSSNPNSNRNQGRHRR